MIRFDAVDLSNDLTIANNNTLLENVGDPDDEKQMLELVLGNLQIGYAVLDSELRYLFFNDRYVELLNRSEYDDQRAGPVVDVLRTMFDNGYFDENGGDIDSIIRVRVNELRTSKPITREFNDSFGIHNRLSIFPMSSGNVMITLTDISEQKKVETEKAIKEDQLHRALDNIEGAVLMYDKELNLQVYSARYLEIGNLPEELFVIGEPIYPILLFRAERGDYGEGDPHKIADERIHFLKSIPDYLYQEQAMANGTAEVYWSRDDQGNLISVTNDITRRKETERLLEEARLEAQAANKAKSEFLANMSHELRTPLNAVIGFSDSMLAGLTGDLNERQKEYIQDISDSGEHLLALINDVLDLSKIEAGKTEVEDAVFDIADVIDESLSLIREMAVASEVAISRKILLNDIQIRGDLRMMKQVVVNLLSNALKFTPQGGCVTISSQLRKDGDLMISVSDTGYGMKPEEIPMALKEFEQTDTGKERGGTGLGLPLTKNIVELHGGVLSIISAPGKGTTAMFSVPHHRIVEVT